MSQCQRHSTYRFDSLRPVPMLSFATRVLGCTAGVMITASHNPPAYNGYKVYWDDGAQVTAPLDREILDEVNAVTDYATVKTMDHDEPWPPVCITPWARRSTTSIWPPSRPWFWITTPSPKPPA